MSEDNKTLTIDELSAYVRVPKGTLYKYTMLNKIPCFRIGRQLRFKKSTIDKWIEKQEKMQKR